MITGKYLWDSRIYIDLKTETATIDYGFDVDNYSSIPVYHGFAFPFLLPFWVIFYFIHHFLVITYISELKFFNAVSYLSFMNRLYASIFGYKIKQFCGNEKTNQIIIHSKNNYSFDYTLTGDYKKYVTSISLQDDTVQKIWLGKIYTYDNGWYFIISFSQPPKTGIATIKYL